MGNCVYIQYKVVVCLRIETPKELYLNLYYDTKLPLPPTFDKKLFCAGSMLT